MSLWLTMVAAGVATFATRLSFIALLDRVSVPAWFQRSLRFVPAAVLSAIILPELARRNGALDITMRNAQLFSGALAAWVAWGTKNVALTIIAGLVALLLFQSLLGLF
jgi:branched-subunit amino acid transport protein